MTNAGVHSRETELSAISVPNLPQTQTLQAYAYSRQSLDKPKVMMGEGAGKPLDRDSLEVSGNRV